MDDDLKRKMAEIEELDLKIRELRRAALKARATASALEAKEKIAKMTDEQKAHLRHQFEATMGKSVAEFLKELQDARDALATRQAELATRALKARAVDRLRNEALKQLNDALREAMQENARRIQTIRASVKAAHETWIATGSFPAPTPPAQMIDIAPILEWITIANDRSKPFPPEDPVMRSKWEEFQRQK